MNYRKYKRSKSIQINRISFLIGFVGLFFGTIIIRLFFLQIIKADEYKSIAKEQYYSDIITPARRGEILTIDYKTGQYNKLATNTTLDLLYIDPTEIPDKMKVAEILAPLIFTEEDYKNCKEDKELCPQGNTVEFASAYSNEELEESEVELKDGRSREELIEAYKQDIFRKISQKEVEFVPIQYGAEPETMSGVIALSLPGVHVNTKQDFIYANPVEIPPSSIKNIAKQLSNLTEISSQKLQNMLKRRDVRYVPLKRKLDPEISDKIWELKFKYKNEFLTNRQKDSDYPNYFKGVVLIPEHWRYYPDEKLASQIIGFVNHDGIGQYGIEGNFNVELQGRKGHSVRQKDVNGAQISVNDHQNTDAVDGKSIVLTIDRVVQQKVEEILLQAVKKFKADSGQVIVMDPFTGRIIAMANAPTFDPNQFGNVYNKRKLKKYERVPHTIRVFVKDEKDRYILAEKNERDNSAIDRYIFENRLGEGVYLNKSIQEIYEPGSVFKPLVMAAAIDAGEVTPQTKYFEDGPLEIDTGTDQKQFIHTALGQYNGWQTMTNVLETSSNIGMAFVSKELGATLLHNYIKDYGFGEMTDVELEGEENGTVIYYKKWPEAQLYTTSFGQGMNATLLQMTSAWGAIANGGLLMQPYIVDSVIDNTTDYIEKTEPEVIRRVISADTSSTISAMLVSAVKNGVAEPASVPGYNLAGKTGTAQIAKTTGVGYEKGEGSTITSFGGYAPIEHPRFVMIVKFDRPRIGENTWGSTTGAPVFREIAEFLLDYYDVPPDES